MSYYGTGYHASNYYGSNYYGPSSEPVAPPVGGGPGISRQKFEDLKKKYFVRVDEKVDEDAINQIVQILIVSGMMDE